MMVYIKKRNGKILDSSKLTEREIESLSFATKLIVYGLDRKPRQTKLTEFMEED